MLHTQVCGVQETRTPMHFQVTLQNENFTERLAYRQVGGGLHQLQPRKVGQGHSSPNSSKDTAGCITGSIFWCKSMKEI